MPTIIDSLLIEVGISPLKGQREAEDAFKKTRERAVKTGKDIEDSSKHAGEFILKLRNNLLGLFAAFTAGRGVKDFVADMTASNAELGRFAQKVNSTPKEIATWRSAGKLFGVDAKDIDSTISGLTQAFEQFSITGESSVVPWFRALGINMADANGNMKPFSNLMLEISQRIKDLHMDSARAVTFMNNMGIAPGMQNLILGGPDAIRRALADAQKLADAEAKDVEAAKKRQRVWNDFKNQAEAVGTVLLTSLTPALIALTNAAKAFAEWGERHPEIVGAAFAALTGIVLALSAALAVSLVGGAIASAVAGFGALIGVASGLSLGLAVLTETALPLLSEAFLALGVAIEATPIGWIITGIAAISVAGYELVKHWDDIKAWWGRTWDWMAGKSHQKSGEIVGNVRGLSGENVQDKSASLIEQLEGFAPSAKWDRNAYRAGYGSSTTTDAKTGKVSPVYLGTNVSEADAKADLSRRLSTEFIPKAQKAIGTEAWNKLSDATRAAIVSVTYNYGSTPSSVVSAARTGDAHRVADAIRGLQGANGGINAKRRNQEASIAEGGSGSDAISKAFSKAPASGLPSGSFLAASVGGGGYSYNNQTSETNIGELKVITQATDAQGIARDLKPTLQNESFAAQANYGPV